MDVDLLRVEVLVEGSSDHGVVVHGNTVLLQEVVEVRLRSVRKRVESQWIQAQKRQSNRRGRKQAR